MTLAKGVAANIAVAGVLAVGAAVACAATAAADPPPPADPAVPAPPTAPAPAPDPPSTLQTTLATVQQAVQPGGSHTVPDFLLSQTAAPALPGSQPATPGMGAAVLNTAQLLLPQNFRSATPDDQGTLYTAQPGDGGATRLDAFRGAHALWHGALGRMDPDQLGDPLPGTAPPPGTNLPAGLGDNLPDQQPPVPAPAPPPPG